MNGHTTQTHRPAVRIARVHSSLSLQCNLLGDCHMHASSAFSFLAPFNDSYNRLPYELEPGVYFTGEGSHTACWYLTGQQAQWSMEPTVVALTVSHKSYQTCLKATLPKRAPAAIQAHVFVELGGAIPAGGRQMKPPGFARDEETFTRTLACATGPFLYLVLTMKAMKEQAEFDVAHLEELQWVCFCICMCAGALRSLPYPLVQQLLHTTWVMCFRMPCWTCC